MNMSDKENKLKKGSVQQNKLEKDAEALTKKEFFFLYSAYAAFANACERTSMPTGSARALTITETTRLRKARAGEKHLDRAIVAAESWSERDKLYRRLASQCYKNQQLFRKSGDDRQALKWMNLALRFLRLSLDPKAKQDMEHIQKELAEVKALAEGKAAMQEQEQEEEEEDGEG
jgi:hypothetical protein